MLDNGVKFFKNGDLTGIFEEIFCERSRKRIRRSDFKDLSALEGLVLGVTGFKN